MHSPISEYHIDDRRHRVQAINSEVDVQRTVVITAILLAIGCDEEAPAPQHNTIEVACDVPDQTWVDLAVLPDGAIYQAARCETDRDYGTVCEPLTAWRLWPDTMLIQGYCAKDDPSISWRLDYSWTEASPSAGSIVVD